MGSTNQHRNVVMSIMRAIDRENKDYSKLFLKKNLESLFEGNGKKSARHTWGQLNSFFYYISVAGHFSIQTSLEEICNLTILVTRWCGKYQKKISNTETFQKSWKTWLNYFNQTTSRTWINQVMSLKLLRYFQNWLMFVGVLIGKNFVSYDVIC